MKAARAVLLQTVYAIHQTRFTRNHRLLCGIDFNYDPLV